MVAKSKSTRVPVIRRICWFMGAGASKAAGASVNIAHHVTLPIPTQSDFWPTLLKIAPSSDEKIIEQFLFRYFKGYERVPTKIKTPVKKRKIFQDVDVEEVFTFLSERISTNTISPSLKKYFETVLGALVRSVYRTFVKFRPNDKTRRIYRKFKQNLITKNDCVISFNYDTTFEKSIPRSCYYAHIDADDKNKVGFFKLHGSINWKRESKKRITRCEVDNKAPVIIAPTHLKFIGLKNAGSLPGHFGQSEVIDEIWKDAEVKMRNADALVFIGYSFPESDLYFSSVLRSVMITSEKNPVIVLINPDSVRISERIGKRFNIGKDQIINHFDFEGFINSKRKSFLHQVERIAANQR